MGVDDRQCFLMMECMETWVIADKDTIAKYYGANFLMNALPKNANLESVPKLTVADALKRATKPTQKGEYKKVAHGFAIIERANVDVVRAALPECERLFRELEARITSQGINE